MDVKSENRRRLLDSVEMHCTVRDLVIILVFTVVCALLPRDDRGEKYLLLLACVPFLVFYLVRICNILRKPGSYRFCRTTFSQPHQNPLAKSMYFTVVLQDENGQNVVRDTHAIFACHGFIGPLMEDYVNRTVTVAYNPETDMVVVIG